MIGQLLIWLSVLTIHLDGMLVEQDTLLLSKIITAECSICPENEQYLVGSTVLNRVENDRFPDNIQEVLYQPNQYLGTKSRWFITTPKSYEVAKNLMDGRNRDKEVLYFYTRDSPNKEFVKSMEEFVKYREKYHIFAISPQANIGRIKSTS